MPECVPMALGNAAGARKSAGQRAATEPTPPSLKCRYGRPRKWGCQASQRLEPGGARLRRALQPGVGPATPSCRMRPNRPLLAVALLLAGAIGADPALADLKQSSLTIDTAAASQRFTVDLAVSPEDQAQGLMFRRSLPRDAGMLF